MARIASIDLPKNKRIEIGLTYIYGIGLPTATKILEATGINPDTRVKDLTEDEIAKLREAIEKRLIEISDKTETSKGLVLYPPLASVLYALIISIKVISSLPKAREGIACKFEVIPTLLSISTSVSSPKKR